MVSRSGRSGGRRQLSDETRAGTAGTHAAARDPGGTAARRVTDARATGLARTFERSDFLGQKIVDDVAKLAAFLLCDPLEAVLQLRLQVDRHTQSCAFPIELAAYS